MKVPFILSIILSAGMGVAQTGDNTIMAFNKSIDQEKNSEFIPAATTMRFNTDTNSYETNLRLGWLFYKAGKYPQSISYYNKAISKAPGAIEPRYGIGFPAYLANDTKVLIDNDTKILELNPLNSTINSNLGVYYYYANEHTKALNHIQKVVKHYPFDYDNNLMMGWTYVRLEKKAEAEKYFNVVLLYAPQDASAKEGLAAIGKTAGSNPAKVQSAFEKSYALVELSKTPDYKAAILAMKEGYDASSYYMNYRLGWLSYYAGSHTDAVTYFKIALQIMPESIEARLGLVYPVDALGNKNEVRQVYEAILKMDPQNTLVNYKLGLMDYEKKDYMSAKQRFETVLRYYPTDLDAMAMMGWTNNMLGKTDEAKIYFSKLLCFSPKNSSATKGLTYKP